MLIAATGINRAEALRPAIVNFAPAMMPTRLLKLYSMAGARLQVWLDPEFRRLALDDAIAASRELGIDWLHPTGFGTPSDFTAFEVLVARLSIREPGVSALAEIVHDIDLKESKFNRPETSGLAAAIVGLCSVHRDDEARLTAGFALFDYMKVHFAKRRS